VQAAGSLEFRQGTAAAGVFGDDVGDSVRAHQGHVGFYGERAAIQDDFGVWYRQDGGGRINEAQQVEMLGLGGEEGKRLLADGEENARRVGGQGGNGGFGVGDMMPIVARLRHPLRAFMGDQRGVGHSARLNRVAADLGGKGMRGVDDMGDLSVDNVVGEAFYTTVAAQAGRQGLLDGVGGAPGVGEYGVDACLGEGVGEGRGFGCATQKKDAHYG
jgi:hypothetical protein